MSSTEITCLCSTGCKSIKCGCKKSIYKSIWCTKLCVECTNETCENMESIEMDQECELTGNLGVLCDMAECGESVKKNRL